MHIIRTTRERKKERERESESEREREHGLYGAGAFWSMYCMFLQ